MNHLSQNELLSAYLDGELTAAETADVERLLATDPAARRLLDELRSLGSMLQALPRQKIGLDLSADVLRIAEQRRKNEELSEAAKPSPATDEPVAPFDFRRFLNRRAALWTGLAVVIAVAISINERNQQKPSTDKELARIETAQSDAKPGRGRVDLGRNDNRFGEPPSIRAVPDTTSELAVKSPVKAREEPKLKALASRPHEKRSAEEFVDGKDATGYGGLGGAGMPSAKAPSAIDTLANKAESNMIAKTAPQTSTLGGRKSPRIGERLVRDKAAAPMHRKGVAAKSKAGLEGGAQPLEGAAPEVLVVYCDISPDAVAKKSFDKLLDANGMVGRRELLREGGANADGFQSLKSQKEGKELAKSAPKKETTRSELGSQEIATGDAELVYVEATPAQLKATLAGLEAQPNVFVSFSVRPAADSLSKQYVHYYLSEQERIQNPTVAGLYTPSRRKNSKQGDSAQSFGTPMACQPAVPKKDAEKNAEKDAEETRDTDLAPNDLAQKSDAVAQPPAPVAAPPQDRALGQLGNAASSNSPAPQAAPNMAPSEQNARVLDGQQRTWQPGFVENYAQSAAPVQRVLFVLRVTGGPGTAAAARTMDKAKMEASKAAAEPVPAPNAPAAKPTPSK